MTTKTIDSLDSLNSHDSQSMNFDSAEATKVTFEDKWLISWIKNKDEWDPQEQGVVYNLYDYYVKFCPVLYKLNKGNFATLFVEGYEPNTKHKLSKDLTKIVYYFKSFNFEFQIIHELFIGILGRSYMMEIYDESEIKVDLSSSTSSESLELLDPEIVGVYFTYNEDYVTKNNLSHSFAIWFKNKANVNIIQRDVESVLAKYYIETKHRINDVVDNSKSNEINKPVSKSVKIKKTTNSNHKFNNINTDKTDKTDKTVSINNIDQMYQMYQLFIKTKNN
jgi:hypothetical protein